MKIEQPTLTQNYSPLCPFPKQELEEGVGRREDCLAEGEEGNLHAI